MFSMPLKMLKNHVSEGYDFEMFQGGMPPDPPKCAAFGGR